MKVKESDCIYCERRGNYGLMICCDRCESWYHYKCVNKKWDLPLRKNHLHYLSDYYCYPCRKANPSLRLTYYSSYNFNRTTLDINEKDKKMKALKLNSSEVPPLNKTTPQSPSSSSDSSWVSSNSSSHSRTKSDEAIENKHPKQTKCGPIFKDLIAPHHHHQQQQQSQQLESTTGIDMSNRRSSLKRSREILMSKLQRDMRRKRQREKKGYIQI